MRFQSVAVALVVLGLGGAAAAPASADEMAQVQSLDNSGEELYAEAASIVANTPHTGMQAAEMVNGSQGPAGRFYDKDRAYQGDLQKIRVIGAGPAPRPHVS